MKFIRPHLESIAGIETFPVISFLIFFAFFLVLLVYVYARPKADMDEMSRLPLNEEPVNETEQI